MKLEEGDIIGPITVNGGDGLREGLEVSVAQVVICQPRNLVFQPQCWDCK